MTTIEKPGSNTVRRSLHLQLAGSRDERCCPSRLGVVDDVRTLRGNFAKLAKKILSALHDDDGRRIIQIIRVLRERFEPELVAKEKTSRQLSHPRRLKAVRGVYRARSADVSWQMPLH